MSEPSGSDRARSRLVVAWLLAVAALGASFRLFHYLFARSLWMDEAMLAINIPIRSYLDLLEPLDYNTSAPFPFLWAERAAVGLFGTSELSLRAVPLLAGLLLVPALGLLARRLYGDAGGCAAALLAALSPTLIRFSNEVKPYGTDALVTVAILTAACRVAERPASRRAWLAFCLAAPLGVLASFPAVFVAGAALSALPWLAEVRRRPAPLLLCAGLCLAAFAIPYLAIYQVPAGSQEVLRHWNAAFLEPGGELVRRARLALPGVLFPAFFGNGSTSPPLGAPVALTIAGLATLGLNEARRRLGVWAAWLLAVPFVLAATASALHRYPFGVPRLMVFAVPLLLLMLAGAGAWLARRLENRVPAPVLVVVGFAALGPTLRDDIAGLRHPFEGEDTRALVAQWREARRGEQEPIYVGAKAIPAWLFYTINWEAPRRDRLDFYALAATHGLAFENRPSRSHAVTDEGSDLVFESRGRREILGIATGREWRWPDYRRPGPDPGWAENEARRIHREAVLNPHNPCAWILFTRLSERANRPLTWALRDGYSGVREHWFQAVGGVIYRYCFPVPGGPPLREDGDPGR